MFLKELYHNNKFLFWFCIVFIAGELFFTIIRIENTPFFLYGMYSKSVHEKNNYEDFIININGKQLNVYDLPDAEKEMILSPLSLYHSLEKNDYRDPLLTTVESRFKGRLPHSMYDQIVKRLTNDTTDIADYFSWMRRYLKRFSSERYLGIQILFGNYQYQPDGKIILTKTDTLLEL